ncbi:peptide-methionine (S)-S-oxide reductase MsrA [Methylobacterium mesophilicum SR1.6/6]|uniref:Peptide methionine sulfoxide reductase MsrA n=1 Tax=Methylobacterium mesophilicum SR1.6/6 TaxID=908290 RepID=A0A6B9FQX0_9HYPH|nr:peptide-methionine (S)-S-oxide reductase MsrA [Methylobacterium mesophilicum]QGY05073.1 peptide-methionine (S)-S-oxide reductase MsrA [Methylobacterium mesophilicum SR1.6/6]
MALRDTVRPLLGAALGLGLAGALLLPRLPAFAEEAPRRLPEAVTRSAEAPGPHVAVFAGGCFWGVQGVFQHVRGVSSAVSGYAGGTRADADYRAVSGGGTGHAEAVKVTYDPALIRYDELLRIFFSVALDPTQVDRQGPDSGSQYRSALFPRDDAQAGVAQAYIAQLDAAKAYARPIATRIEPGAAFYPAEAYHQDFMALHPGHPYITVNDAPKLEALRTLFPERTAPQPVLVNRPPA